MDIDLGEMIGAGIEIVQNIFEKKENMNSEYCTEQRRRQKWFRLNLLLITPGIAFAIFGLGSLGFYWWTLPAWLFLICLNIWTWLQVASKY